MRRIMLTVAYDGTDYCGWQVQPNGITIEEVLNRALSRLTREDIAVTGASRTDAGVHAEGNVAVFDTASTIPPERFAYAVNPLLPEDIVVVKSEEVPPDWHPRHQASVKTYEYRILNREMPDPLRRRDAWHVSFPLDVEKMRLAAAYLWGNMISAISAISTPGQRRPCARFSAWTWSGRATWITLRISGNGFLYNMVRIITGTLVETGRGFRSPESVKELIDGKSGGKTGATALPQGLVLKSIEYSGK